MIKVGYLSLLSVILTILNANGITDLSWYVVFAPAIIDLGKEMYLYAKAKQFRRDVLNMVIKNMSMEGENKKDAE